MIHGFASSGRGWRCLTDFILASSPTYTVSWFEYDSALGIKAAATNLSSIIDGFGYARNVFLIGHSLGGLVARATRRSLRSTSLSGIVCLGSPHNGISAESMFVSRAIGVCESIEKFIHPMLRKSPVVRELTKMDADAVLDELNSFDAAATDLCPIVSVSGGLDRLPLEDGLGLLYRRLAASILTSPNDGLVEEQSCDLARCIGTHDGDVTHWNDYSSYRYVHHFSLREDQQIALRLCQWIGDHASFRAPSMGMPATTMEPALAEQQASPGHSESTGDAILD